MLQFMGSQRVGHDLAKNNNQTCKQSKKEREQHMKERAFRGNRGYARKRKCKSKTISTVLGE